MSIPCVIIRLLEGVFALFGGNFSQIFGLCSRDLFVEELAVLGTQTAELHASRLSVGGACAGPSEERPQDPAKMHGAVYL